MPRKGGRTVRPARTKTLVVGSKLEKRVTPETARQFVKGLRLPAPPRRGGLGFAGDDPPSGTATAFETARTEAAVTGSGVIAFVSGVSAERRQAIVNSSLLAQLGASAKVKDQSKIYDWYNEYFDVLSNIGWVVQDRGFAEYTEASSNFEAHKAIMTIATTLLGPATTALEIVKSTIGALQSMDESTPWIKIFGRDSQHAKAARFQVGLAETAADGQFLVNLMAFGLEAKSTITQVLVFKAKKSEARLRHYSGKVTINTDVLDQVRDDIAAQLVSRARDYIRKLP